VEERDGMCRKNGVCEEHRLLTEIHKELNELKVIADEFGNGNKKRS